MTDLQRAAAAAAADLGEALRRQGWDLADDGSCLGDIRTPSRSVAVKIEFPTGFPFIPPRVKPIDGSGTYSWHQEPDGWLCLYSPGDSGERPWLDPDRLIERIEEWFTKDAAGWPDDPPDLDLDRYFERVEGLVVYEDLERLLGRTCHLDRHGERWEVQLGGLPRRGADGMLIGHGVDLGELERPIRDWDGLTAAVDNGTAADLTRRARRGELHVILARYTRQGHTAAIALRVISARNLSRSPTLKAIPSASAGPATLRLRSGEQADALSERTVAIIGLGAVGSFLADLLARSGLRHLHLIDGDQLRPGNSVRHLLPQRYWGWNKAKGVADHLRKAHDQLEVTTLEEGLVSIDGTEAAFESHDLVIDATANTWTNELIAQAAGTLRRDALTVYLQRSGGIVRIDRWPLHDREHPLAGVPRLPGKGRTELREAGCGDPVSPTPPWAVTAAASRAAGVAIRMLLGQSVPPTVVDVLIPQPDEPYTALDVIT